MQRESPARRWERAKSTEAAVRSEVAVAVSVPAGSVSGQMYGYEQGEWIEVLSGGCERCAPHGQVSPRCAASVL